MKKLILSILICSMLLLGCNKKGNYNDLGVLMIEDNLTPEWIENKGDLK